MTITPILLSVGYGNPGVGVRKSGCPHCKKLSAPTSTGINNINNNVVNHRNLSVTCPVTVKVVPPTPPPSPAGGGGAGILILGLVVGAMFLMEKK